MTVPAERLPKALHDLTSRDTVSEAVVLSTCTRTDGSAEAATFHGAVAAVRTSLSELSYVAAAAFADHLYTLCGAGAAARLFSVAAGLDSAVLGESEML